MAEFVIIALSSVLLIGMSLQANAKLRQWDRLPMQWSASGNVNWTAPRVAALSFVPGLAIAILAGAAGMMQVSKPRPGQEGFEIPVLVALALTFLAVHRFHIWMIKKHCRSGKR